ncbi:AraC family transcriptional regulator [Rugamonas sp.]|uniref:AraC family transcriptional regulator n=1 Tax=Rugamonas sp. TaxID=1926287 RepID=UPI0026008CB7|nr:AraC family transcriptional regulator [Rugamonas sp.]
MTHKHSPDLATWRNTHLPGTVFLRADYRGQRFERHFHEEYAIGVIDSGCQAFEYDQGRRLDMPSGSVALIAPGVVHSGWPGAENGWRYRMMYPDAARVRAALDEVFGGLPAAHFHRPVVSDARLYWRLSRLHDAAADPHADPLELEGLYLAVIHDAFARHAGARAPAAAARHAPAIARVRELLAAESARAVTIAELSQVSGLGKFQVIRQFQAIHGLPPHAYLRQLRVQHARHAVLAGVALADAALLAGFADQAHMTRAFRLTLGYTPGMLAHSLRPAAISFKK